MSPHSCRIAVRGYELDSFGHVNNAVYLNYLEEARWQILRDLNLMDYFLENRLLLVVVKLTIRYIREIRLLDELEVRTDVRKSMPYLVFDQDIVNTKSGKAAARARVTTLFVDQNRLPIDFPDTILTERGERVAIFTECDHGAAVEREG